MIAEGYLWEIERRGFAQFGTQIPVVVLEKPDEVEMLHEEFALAGSDVIEAFTVCETQVLGFSKYSWMLAIATSKCNMNTVDDGNNLV